MQSQFPKFKVKKKKLYVGPFLSPQNFNSTSFKSYLYKAPSFGATRCTCEWLWYFSRELNSFLEIPSSAEYSKLLVSWNSERETEFKEKFKIEILVRFRRAADYEGTFVGRVCGFILCYLNLLTDKTDTALYDNTVLRLK